MRAKGGRASLQTFHAIQASDLAAAMNEALKKVRVPPGDYAPELMAPQGPSTAGGVQAMQHLRLVAGQAGQPTLVVGYANHAEGKAELRTYEYVDAVYRQRFNRPLSLDRAEYVAFLGFAKQVFSALHLQTTVVGPPADFDAEGTALPDKGGMPKAMVALVVTVVLAALALGTWAIFVRG
jgi:hypothetical protein